MQDITRKIHVADVAKEYIIDISEGTRADPELLLGASPRASLYLLRASRTHAAIDGRDYVAPDDIKAIIEPVLNHRLILRPEAQMRGVTVHEVLERVGQTVPVPGTRVPS
jgi:MoxR-like ATPase